MITKRAIGLADAAKRHLFDGIESIICTPIALFTMLLIDKNRRLGDYLAKTEIVYYRKQGNASKTIELTNFFSEL